MSWSYISVLIQFQSGIKFQLDAHMYKHRHTLTVVVKNPLVSRIFFPVILQTKQKHVDPFSQITFDIINQTMKLTHGTQSNDSFVIIGTIIAQYHDRKFTCEPHYDHEDTSSHIKSALCMQKLGNRLNDTFDRDLLMTLLT